MAGGATTFFSSQPASKSQHFSKLLVLPGRSRLNIAQNNVIHRTILAYFPRYRGMVNTSARVGTAAYSCKTRAVRSRMRLSTAVEHPGDPLLTVTIDNKYTYLLSMP